MAPTKNTRGATNKQNGTASLLALARKTTTRRTAQSALENVDLDSLQTRGKRKAEHSPLKNEAAKRSALGNLTNNARCTTLYAQRSDEDLKPFMDKSTAVYATSSDENVVPFKDLQNIAGKGGSFARKITTRAAAKTTFGAKVVDNREQNAPSTVIHKAKEHKVIVPPAPVAAAVPHALQIQHKQVRRISNEFNKTEESLYMSALEDVSENESARLSGNFEAAKRRSMQLQQMQEQIKTEESALAAAVPEQVEDHTFDPHLPSVAPVPEGIEDFDKATWDDPFQVAHYTMDIFNYLKQREPEFVIDDYMPKQIHLSKWMRSLLVDWMVEVQETFELNHETLYLAVKVVDLYLGRVVIKKDKLQLLGAAALFIACKYDERTPPLVEDFLYICDGAYKHAELIRMERQVLRTIDFDLGIPLSYRFLRRYARTDKVRMPTLTLARYILELALMDYDTIRYSDSKMACAALFMALRLHGEPAPWSATLEYYSGYALVDFADIVPVLNANLHRSPKNSGTIKTIKNKYSHKIFHQVALVSLMTTEELFHNNIDLNSSTKKERDVSLS